MARVFISYARANRTEALSIKDDIVVIGHEAWIDQQLIGGQEWWTEIIHRIQASDIFVFLVSDASINSVACEREAEYADKLNKPIIPLFIEKPASTRLIPPSIAGRQWIDYTSNEKQTGLRLAIALSSADTTRTLPDPLPAPPDIPMSAITQIWQQLKQKSLGQKEQSLILLDIKAALKDPTLLDDAMALIIRLKDRADIADQVSEEINEVIASTKMPTTRRSSKKDEGVSRPQIKTLQPILPATETKPVDAIETARAKRKRSNSLKMTGVTIQYGTLVAVLWSFPVINIFSIPALIAVMAYMDPRPRIGFPLAPLLIWLTLFVMLSISGNVFGAFFVYALLSLSTGIVVARQFVKARRRRKPKFLI